jgi:hypothetical protein
MPSIGKNLQSETNFRVGVSFDDHCLAKTMKEAFEVTCETKMARIYDNQDNKMCTSSEQETHQSC